VNDMDYYDKYGTMMGLEEYARLNADEDYRRVGYTKLGEHVISTVWMGLDHNWGGGTPIIFETMVFPSEENFEEQDCDRYATLEEAKAGHTAMVYKWAKRLGNES